MQKRIFKFDGSRDPQQSLELMERGTLVRKPDEAPTLLACRGAAEGLPGGVLVPGRAAPRQSPGPSASPVQLARAGLVLKDAETNKPQVLTIPTEKAKDALNNYTEKSSA